MCQLASWLRCGRRAVGGGSSACGGVRCGLACAHWAKRGSDRWSDQSRWSARMLAWIVAGPALSRERTARTAAAAHRNPGALTNSATAQRRAPCLSRNQAWQGLNSGRDIIPQLSGPLPSGGAGAGKPLPSRTCEPAHRTPGAARACSHPRIAQLGEYGRDHDEQGSWEASRRRAVIRRRTPATRAAPLPRRLSALQPASSGTVRRRCRRRRPTT